VVNNSETGVTTATDCFSRWRISLLNISGKTAGFLEKEKGMKKVAIIITALVLLYLTFKAGAIQNLLNNFIDSNASHAEKVTQDFLNQ